MPYIGQSPTQVAFVTDTFSGNSSTTAFTMSVAPANTASVLVAVSGVLQDPSTYSVSGLTLTFSAAPPTGTGNISCRYLGIPASGITTTAYRTVTEFTATASQTTFTPPSYTAGFINVYRNGVLLGSADYTATNGTTVVLATGATAGDLVTVESFLVSSVLNAIPTTGGTISGNLGLTGNLIMGGSSSPWGSTYSVVDGPVAVVGSQSTPVLGSFFISNGYHDGTNWRYKNNGYANLIYTNTTSSNGDLLIYSAVSGTAGAVISWNLCQQQTNGGNLRLRTADAGIQFNKTGALNNSYLNDYEEGTWTPTLSGFSGTGITATANYTKIGRVMYCSVTLAPSSGTMTGSSMNITQPFSGSSYGTGTWMGAGSGQTGGIQAVPFGNVAALSGSLSATTIMNLGWFMFI